MKRRIRKKKRLSEYQEFGFEVSFDIPTGLSVVDRNAILDDFITQAIEANGLQFGGGGDTHWQGFVTLNKRRGSVIEQHREPVRNWLNRNPQISNVSVGDLRDAWHGWEDD